MLDIGWSELILIGIVALIVVGPKDLPRMFHTLGRFTGKLRSMGREFQSAMNDAARQSGLDEVKRDLGELASKKGLGLDALETAANKFEKWDPTRAKAPVVAAGATAAATTVAASGVAAGAATAAAPAAMAVAAGAAAAAAEAGAFDLAASIADEMAADEGEFDGPDFDGSFDDEDFPGSDGRAGA